MSYATRHLSKATDKQLALIRYLESELDTPYRLSPGILASLTKMEAGWKIKKLYDIQSKRLKEKQMVLF